MALESDNTNNMSNNTRVQQLLAVQNEALNLFRKKNTDYGDSFATYGTIGVLVRLGDKIQRLQSVTSNGINLVEDEKIRDTLMDLHNYAGMAIMLLDNSSTIENVNIYKPFNKNITNKWTIKGHSGNIYTRENITYPNGKIIRSCTCPSFKYSSYLNKRCKHTK